MKNFLLASLLLLFCSYTSQAQILKCGDDHYRKHLIQSYPGIEEHMHAPNDRNASRSSDVYRIPVVVHVVYNTNEENVSEAIIRSQIDILNQDFRRQNADASQTRAVFKGVAGDAMIEFYLADTDPNGNPTSGITRKKTNKKSFIEFDVFLLFQAAIACGVDFNDPVSIEENMECLQAFFEANGASFENILAGIDDVKYADKGGTDPWDQKKYLNIWVCNLALDVLGEQVPFVLGFAYPPVGAPLFPPGSLPEGYEVNDGVVIHYPVFGINNPGIGSLAGLNDKGRTCTHEVGHYLGLRHIWGDGDCTVDDGISDTPDADDSSQAEDPTITCESLFTKNTCSEITTELPDMIENYMDYSKESCMNMFSQGQINMMRSMLEGPRAELVGLPASVQTEIEAPFVVYPNPAYNELNIELRGMDQHQITLFDMMGKIVYQNPSGTTKIDISGLTNGLYIVQLLGENQSFSTRFTIQK